MTKTKLGIIGGSGLYDLEGLENMQRLRLESPFGEPSDELVFGTLDGQELVFLPRHGKGHRYSPTDINYRANIDALKRAGVTDILSISAVGSFREDLKPGDFVIVDQYVDRTFARDKSFFGPGLVAHVSFAHPTCDSLSDVVERALKQEGIPCHRGGTYLAMEGPQFSTIAESRMYRAWGCDVIGMSNMPEAKLAREAEICYCPVVMVTDYDSWHPDHGTVDVQEILKTLSANVDKGKRLVRTVAPLLAQAGDRHPCVKGCDHALDTAMMTAPAARDPQMLARLSAITARVLGGEEK
ncbi:S-methyl-5'-thioadenosine phosphorylase [Emcibacter nanhaiensis]|uniref:S-methyl-5'-thioadenosine phosphorylase n=1 Tax=Emcibacter nanhaiensis TaxID=1505037 RepID=A0A501PH86_9PROT|nr:S-methyl-5'-thioadenosine phosphorylase [Emcibacter nanhaiensis]TPD59438.1 S-methyl-5'-thioadenosine phosphorylase [Emcibacter nanhaiensis]